MNPDFVAAAERWLAALPGSAACASVAATRLVRLAADEPPWQGTGIRVEAAEAYSLFAAGRVQWSPRDPTLYAGPRYHLWARISPGGRIVNPTCDTGTFIADVAGELQVGIYMGVWKNDRGELATPDALYRRLTGGIDVLAVVWRGDPRIALAAVDADVSRPLFIPEELARLGAPRALPEDWDYLLDTGCAGIFAGSVGPSGERTLKLHAHDDQGIVCKPVDCALTPLTRIAWRWRVTSCPSAVAENRPQTHDYISIATEFDNGRDLTWIWSSELARDTHFHCPIGAWTARETHWVVRSGNDALGQWCSEERNVHADVCAAMGPPPTRIVRVWLIAVSSFQHGTARAEFADIVLDDGTHALRVL